jgi:hypothetical protein
MDLIRASMKAFATMDGGVSQRCRWQPFSLCIAAIMATRTVRNAGAIASYVRVAQWLQQFGKKALLLRQPDNPVGNARLLKALLNADSQRRLTQSVCCASITNAFAPPANLARCRHRSYAKLLAAVSNAAPRRRPFVPPLVPIRATASAILDAPGGL